MSASASSAQEENHSSRQPLLPRHHRLDGFGIVPKPLLEFLSLRLPSTLSIHHGGQMVAHGVQHVLVIPTKLLLRLGINLANRCP
jgi:hypothetical protein